MELADETATVSDNRFWKTLFYIHQKTHQTSALDIKNKLYIITLVKFSTFVFFLFG